MTRWPRRLLIGGIGLLVVFACVGGGFLYLLHRMAPALGQMAPAEFTENAAPEFRREFPSIYHFLLENPDYQVTHFRVQRGLGGCWGRLTLRRNWGGGTDRAALANVLEGGLERGGWTKGAWSINGARGLLDVDPTKLGADDLQYGHTALSGERKSVFHNLRVWIARDAAEFVAYCEMGW